MTRRSFYLLIIPLSLSAFTHLWNPVGFPDIFYDEGIYLRRAMHLLGGFGPQESPTFYDHPFFGQIFLASIFKTIGYPNFLNPTSSIHSVEMLYIVPRVLMGILAVIDTFLIYKISEIRYNSKVALIASILFAVMPLSWFTRRILLEPIQLPFLLSSILFALYAIKAGNNTSIINGNYDKVRRIKMIKEIMPILLSGLLLGLAIFTKIPAITTIPLIIYLILVSYNIGHQRWKLLGIWFMPVVLIPLIWPVYSIAVGQFDSWLNGISYQIGREKVSLLQNLSNLFRIDPILLLLFIAGLIAAAVKKDLFILLLAIPNIIFLYIVGYVSFRLFIPLIPLFCITAAVMISELLDRVKNKSIYRVLSGGVIIIIGIFGLISTLLLVTTQVTAGQFQSTVFVSTYLKNFENKFHDKHEVTTAASPTYSWIFKYVFGNDNVLFNYRDILYEPIKTDNVLLISDDHFRQDIKSNKKLGQFYNNTVLLAAFNDTRNIFNEDNYPYYSMKLNHEGLEAIEIRIGNNTINS
ncbi:MAG: glycosyltransferase [Thaumarchaeota archaeon]|nr:MAG: glycosyltransferase [Nitrososphaerota archaeon]